MKRFPWLRVLIAATMFAWPHEAIRGERSIAPDSTCRDSVLPAGRLPMYSIQRLESAAVRQVRTYLAHECWALALQTYYSRFRPDLPDWVVYVDSAGAIRQGLVGGRTRDGSSQMFDGERYIWAIVFVDLPMHRTDSRPPAFDGAKPPERPASASRSDAPRGPEPQPAPRPAPGGVVASPNADVVKLPLADTTDLWLARRTIAYQRDPMVATLIKGLSKLIGVQPNSDPAAPDSMRAIQLQQVSADSEESMWVGYGRFGLVNNAQIELSLSPVRGKEFPDPIAPPGQAPPAKTDHIFADFVNARQHTFDVAIVAGATTGAAIPTYSTTTLLVTGKSAQVSANAYLAAVWNLPISSPVRVPDPFWEQSRIGIFAGTNVLRGNVGDELIAGITLGRLFGDAGLALGCSWTQGQALSGKVIVNRYRARLLIGTDLRL